MLKKAGEILSGWHEVVNFAYIFEMGWAEWLVKAEKRSILMFDGQNDQIDM